MTAVYVTAEGETLDYIAWRHYGTTDGAVVEQVLAANPGLADLGPVYRPGVEIQMPAVVTQAVDQGVRLWD